MSEKVTIHGCNGELFSSPDKRKAEHKPSLVETYYDKTKDIQQHKQTLKEKYFSNVNSVYDQEEEVYKQLLENQKKQSEEREMELLASSSPAKRRQTQRNTLIGIKTQVSQLMAQSFKNKGCSQGFQGPNFNISPLSHKNSINLSPENKNIYNNNEQKLTFSQMNNNRNNSVNNPQSNIKNTNESFDSESSYFILREDSKIAEYQAKMFQRKQEQGTENAQIVHYIEKINLKYHKDKKTQENIEKTLKEKSDILQKKKSYVNPVENGIIKSRLKDASNMLESQVQNMKNGNDRYKEKIWYKFKKYEIEHRNLPRVMKGEKQYHKNIEDQQEFSNFQQLQKYKDIFSSKGNTFQRKGDISNRISSKLRSLSHQVQSKKFSNQRMKISPRNYNYHNNNNENGSSDGDDYYVPKHENTIFLRRDPEKSPVIEDWNQTADTMIRNIRSEQGPRPGKRDFNHSLKPLSQNHGKIQPVKLKNLQQKLQQQQEKKMRSISEFKRIQNETQKKEFMHQSSNNFLQQLSKSKNKISHQKDNMNKTEKELTQANVTIKFLKNLPNRPFSQQPTSRKQNQLKRKEILDIFYNMKSDPVDISCEHSRIQDHQQQQNSLRKTLERKFQAKNQQAIEQNQDKILKYGHNQNILNKNEEQDDELNDTQSPFRKTLIESIGIKHKPLNLFASYDQSATEK